MSVSSIYNNSSYSSVSSLLQGLGVNMNDTDAADSTSKSSSSGKSTKSSANSLYSVAGSPRNLAAAVKAAMDDLGLDANDKVTFQTLRDYRDQLQDRFTSKLRQELLEAGVDKDVSFRLVSGSDGTGVQVVTDSPDKEKIEQYFKYNPEMVEEFEKIQALNKMEETRKSQRLDVKSIKSRLQMESMTAWFSDTSSFMAFSAQGASYYSGINAIA